MEVKNVMNDSTYIASSDTSVGEVAKKMRDLDTGSIPVCNEQNQFMGIVTVRDIVLKGIAEEIDSTTNISGIMSRGVASVAPDTDVHEAAKIMGRNKTRMLPVVENNTVVGMISRRDLSVGSDL